MCKLILCIPILGAVYVASIGLALNAGTTPGAVAGWSANFGVQNDIQNDKKDLKKDNQDLRNDRKDVRKDQRPAACCAISKIDPRAALVTAQVAGTGQVFQFKVPDSTLLSTLHVGQPIYANFSTHQVSVDGLASCCSITSIGASGAGGSAAIQSEQTQQKPSSSANGQTGSKTTTQKPRDVGSNTFGVGNTSVQPAEPTTEVATRAATRGGALAPSTPGSPPATKSLVANPQLANFECLPNQLSSGTPIHCKVGLNGIVPGGPRSTIAVGSNNQSAQVQITTKPTAVAVPQTVVISPGRNNAEFSIPTFPDAQGGWVAIYAAYQGATLSSAVKLIPSAIRDVKCFDGASALGPSIQGADTCSITPWSQRPYGVIVHPTQPPGQTITITLSEPGRLHHQSSTGSVVIPANQAFGGVWYPSRDVSTVYVCSQSSRCDYFEPVPKTENHTVTIRDPTSGVIHSVTFNVLPAIIRGVGFGDTIAAAQNPITVPSRPGRNLTAWVSFNAPPAPTDWNSQNAWLDVKYGGSSDPNRGNVVVQGPTNLGIKEQQCGFPTGDNPVDPATYCEWHIDRPDLNVFSFQVTVGACSQAENPNGCQATVTVSSNQALGRAIATINVTPQ